MDICALAVIELLSQDHPAAISAGALPAISWRGFPYEQGVRGTFPSVVLSAAYSVTNRRQKGRNEQDTDTAQGSLGSPVAHWNVNGFD